MSNKPFPPVRYQASVNYPGEIDIVVHIAFLRTLLRNAEEDNVELVTIASPYPSELPIEEAKQALNAQQQYLNDLRYES